MLRSHMFSFLARQQLVLGKRFTARYPHSWLVWEPGAWKAPIPDLSVASTKLPAKGAKPLTPNDTDALCFELAFTKPAELKVGRGEGNDVVLPDVTVSREHCFLGFDGRHWSVTASPTVKSLVVAGVPLAPGSSARLLSGDGVQLGDVRLTFQSPEAFEKRIAAAALNVTGGPHRSNLQRG